MIIGVYQNNALRVMLEVIGHRGEEKVEFVVDTAFEGDLSLPEEIIRRLGMSLLREELRMLADGTALRCRVYGAALEWGDTEIVVEVLSLANRPILGTMLLADHHLDIEAVDGGSVVIEPL